MAMTVESFDDSTPAFGIPAATEREPGKHRDPTGSFAAPSSTIEEQSRLDRRRVHSLTVAIFAGTVIMVFGVLSLLQPDHQGWLPVAVGFAVVAVATLVLVLDPPRRGLMSRRHLKGRRNRRH
ncbi:hypothetical protein LQ327_25100 [Actinomycetospora endophytica]|uniref:DUF3040 family protein n=1 Tax=Actinomycetospora endophytica TaxID=2291215 RepID=A0ABS8PEF0_9PSEU|nr:hypothetical protein [Actinomycetospora endophytica]MCD2196652.1 hypothetical protein [Actinomycetospora endophytica]